MKKLLFPIAILLSFISIQQISAADAPVYAYISERSSFKTERVMYNAIIAAGGIPRIERIRSIDFFDLFSMSQSAVVTGEFELSKLESRDDFVKIDVPIGKVDYTAYVRADSGSHFDSWDDIEGLSVADVLDFEHGLARLVDGSVDVYVAAIYDSVKPKLPEGIVEAGVLQSDSTYCWYLKSQPEMGDILVNGIQNIQSSGVFGRIQANKSVKADNPKVAFQLSSYSTEMIWEMQAEETFREIFIEHEDTVSLFIHSMNFRRINYRDAQFETTTTFARSTFMNEFPDVIIAMDNDALSYLQENYRQMFYGVPVVFCGINSYNEKLISEFSQFATGLSEYIDPTETVEFALAFNPNINRIYTIFDETSSASPVKASLMGAIEEKYGDKMDEITSCGSQPFAEIVKEIQGFDKNTMILIGTYFSDKEGQFIPENEVAERLSEAVDIPIYSLMSGYLGYGVVGGRVAYSRSFIAEAAHIAIRILHGEDVSSIPIIGEYESEARFNTFIVDKKAADRFGIHENLYADRAVVLNKDVSIFEEYPIQSTATVAAIIIILIVSVLCILWMHDKRIKDLALISAEKEKENNRTKSDFLARMSHEIRTPLNAIIGIDELILRDDTSERVRKNALIIKHSGKSLLSIINDILDFSKIESGKMELTLVDYDVGSLLYDTISMIRVKVAEKNIRAEVDVSPDFPAYMYGDEIRVRQILLNILNNSAKYTNEGKITLKAEFEFDSEEKTSGTAVLSVIDTGIGIRKEDIGKLFAAFSQVDTKANRKIEGTGLGLAITETLIALMKGSVKVSSEYGKGSVFTVRIPQEIHNYKPLENVSEAFRKRALEDERGKPDSFIAPDAHILAVDDIDANLLVITGLLLPYNVKVDTASNGQDAIDAVKRKDYDFIFMDHMMPGMDGMEATKKIRTLEGEKYQQIPIIALTANAISGMKEMYLENGFNDFISKPIEIRELERIMQTWIPKEKRKMFIHDTQEAEPSILKGLEAIKGIDISKGLNLFSGKSELYEKILRLFATDLQNKTEEMLRMAEENDFDKLKSCVHTIKGMAGNVSCTEIYELSKNLESAVREYDHDAVSKELPLLTEKIKNVVQSINENLQQ
ncbi:MAG: response regulator [Treponema sp.]|jgi:signal transduction histidine kinase/response regulator RpfG family c-di-GMP phosphodiesterase|nr:response regulator [Treponema sp.]